MLWVRLNMEKFLDPNFIKFFLPLVGAVFAWVLNEHRKQRAEEYLRKEARYLELLKSLKGFYLSGFSDVSDSVQLKRKFLDQLDQCWLYCPDNVIKKGYAFLGTVHTDKESSENEKEKALGDFVVAIRNDLLSHRFRGSSKLRAEDFKIYYVT